MPRSKTRSLSEKSDGLFYSDTALGDWASVKHWESMHPKCIGNEGSTEGAAAVIGRRKFTNWKHFVVDNVIYLW